MLKLNVARALKLKGIDDVTSYLKKLGYQRTKAYNISNGRHRMVELADLEHLCLHLRCTPNDLLEWTPTKPTDDMAEHPLQAIRRKDSAVALVELVQSLPVEDMAEVERFILERHKGQQSST